MSYRALIFRKGNLIRGNLGRGNGVRFLALPGNAGHCVGDSWSVRTESLQLQKAYFAIGAIKFAQRSKPADSGMEGSDAPVVSDRFRP